MSLSSGEIDILSKHLEQDSLADSHSLKDCARSFF